MIVTESEMLNVIIVNYNAGALLRQCVDSVLSSQGVSVRCVVVDNASADDSLAFVDEPPYKGDKLLVIRNNRNLGFAVAVNQGVAAGAGSWFCLLNPDAVLAPDSLAMLLQQARNIPQAGVLGPLIVNRDGSEQRGCRRDLPTPLDALIQALQLHRLSPRLDFNHNRRPLPTLVIQIPAISGACMLVQRRAHEQVGGFDEGFFLHFEDLDYCARMQQAGWDVYFVPGVRIVHAQGACSQDNPQRISDFKAAGMRRYFARHPAGQRALLPLLSALLRVRGLLRRST